MTGNSLDFGPRRHPRRMSLTPMIDVVFLLLIFFMLASRFGTDAVLPVAAGAEGPGTTWQGAPRLIDIGPQSLALNGVPVAAADLAAALAPLMPAPDAALVLRPRDGADLQRLVEVMDLLRAGGFDTLVLVE
ncbi:ExbD/TolR family protein [Paracoccus spongiarum]|uniref:Biopolymer transporter ExbD n=1 Tax=Paracoccus spongiarum TaxID=3064387 RepID=A0ABT9JE85_9RHOB|nr:biopolymer transporter ExbD [Paracoccus sp. 2205BS29-5]MDP5307935.1 biopolymer transporter ExbD [Paracoccus sp. 2205BS29-5]